MKKPQFHVRLDQSASGNVLRLNRWLHQLGAAQPARRGRLARAAQHRQALKHPRVRRVLAGQVIA